MTDMIVFSDPDDEQVKLMGTLFDVSTDSYQPASATNSSSEGVPWGYNNNRVFTSADFGRGKQNSWDIIHAQGGDPQNTYPNATDPTPYAVWLCHKLVVTLPGPTEYEDWFLPSIEELKEMHREMLRSDKVPRNNMDDMNKHWRGMYWSSTEGSAPNAAQYVNYWDGTLGEVPKSSTAKVRCVHEL
jgi:hypothetical protein